MNFRKGAVGALMDEYERAARDLMNVFKSIQEERYAAVLDPSTRDENCRSIQAIMSHVVGSGYGYASYLRTSFHVDASRPAKRQLAFSEVEQEMKRMIGYTIETLQGRWEMSDEEMIATRLDTKWGTVYDMEQLLEHAIVHILRHRRQIEKLLAFA